MMQATSARWKVMSAAAAAALLVGIPTVLATPASGAAALRMIVSPADQAWAGESLNVKSLDPCPTRSGTVTVSARDSAHGEQVVGYAQVPVANDGSWSATVQTFPGEVLVTTTVSATCSGDGSAYVSRQSVSTRPAGIIAVVPASTIPLPHVITVSSYTPCRQPAKRVHVSISNVNLVWAAIFPVAADGSWSGSLELTWDELYRGKLQGMAVHASCDANDVEDLTVYTYPATPIKIVEPYEELKYVALGDSFSSGEGAGAGNYFKDSNGADNPCHRAPTAWTFMVAQSSPQLKDPMVNAACSGAMTKHVLSTPFNGEQPQIDLLRQENAKSKVDLITITIGGNDAGFSGLVTDCFLTDCTVDARTGRWRAKAREAARALAQDIVPKMREAAPNARIVVVGYPRLLPTQQKSVVNCGWLTSTERVALNTVAKQLNQFVIDAIYTELFEKPGYIAPDFINPTDALSGHELCTAQSHVVKIYGNKWNHEQAHPNLLGQGDLARVVRQGLLQIGAISA